VTHKFAEMWRSVTGGRYTRALEREVARLRAENRALLNSILGIAGVPPIVAEAAPNEFASIGSVDTENLRAMRGAPDSQRQSTARAMQVSSPMRRRSWKQINRLLEFESAKKVNDRQTASEAETSSPYHWPGEAGTQTLSAASKSTE